MVEKKGSGFAVILIMAVLFVAALWLLMGSGQGAPMPTDVVLELEGKHFQGSEDAEVVIVEFSDFQCPFCGRHYGTAYQQIKSEYVETGKVRYYFKHLPLTSIHPMAQKAAEAAECAADQELFWELHDNFFEKNVQGQAMGSVDVIKAWAAELEGLDTGAFNACLDSGEKSQLVAEDLNEGIAIMGNRLGSPTFIINGRMVQGAMPFSRFKQIIDEELGG